MFGAVGFNGPGSVGAVSRDATVAGAFTVLLAGAGVAFLEPLKVNRFRGMSSSR